MDVVAAVRALEGQLREHANSARAVQEKRYLKSELLHLGVPVPAIRSTAKGFLAAHPDLCRAEFLDLVAGLWAGGVHECRVCAAELLDQRADLLGPAEAKQLERYVRESRTWALVDNLATGPVAVLVERYAELGEILDRWAVDPDFWVRRAALLALLPALRRGEGDFARFGRHADTMLREREFFIRKAIGWVLRDVGRNRPGLVTDWLSPRADRASGLTVREAVRHLPQEQRAAILAARGSPAQREAS